MFLFFFFNDTATTEIYTLSLHDALPISLRDPVFPAKDHWCADLHADRRCGYLCWRDALHGVRSEEHTSELQSHLNLVCRLLLEKKNACRLASYGGVGYTQNISINILSDE